MYLARRGSPGRRQASAYSPGSARMWIGMAAQPNPRASLAMPLGGCRALPGIRLTRVLGVVPPDVCTRFHCATIRAVSDAIEPRLDQILDFCAEDPVERVFLEDVARRRLGRFTAFAEDERLTA